jgi:hypothetical protein
VENDINEALLGLFIPWEDLSQAFDEHAANATQFLEARDACSYVWNILEPGLPPYIRRLALNITYIRKGKEQAELDRKSQQLEAEEWEGINITDEVFEDGGADDSLDQYIPKDIEMSDLLHAWSEVLSKWDQEATKNTVYSALHPTPNLSSVENLRLQGPSSFIVLEGVEQYEQDVVSIWEDRLKGLQKRKKALNEPTFSTNALHPSDPELESTELTPVLSFLDIDSASLTQLKAYSKADRSLPNLIRLVGTKFSLNKKQLIVVKILLHAVLNMPQNLVTDPSEQTLLYIGGEGGTGKTEVIKAFLFGMELLDTSNQVILSAPTGAAASHIKGSTVHAVLGIGRDQNDAARMSKAAAERRIALKHKRVLITDEIGMVGKKLLYRVDQQCKGIFSLPTDSGALFGGLPVVVALGDFHQFPPVLDQALWAPSPVKGQSLHLEEIWPRFNNAVILTESMRQQGDVAYQALLRRAKKGEMTQADVDMLNDRTVAKQVARGYEMPAVTLCQRNDLRARSNRQQIREYADLTGQKIFIFAAKHESLVESAGRPPSFSLADALHIEDGGGLKGPGLLMYTPGMPVVLLHNIYTEGGLVNGLRGTAVGVVHDPNAKMVEVGGPYILCDRPPRCILVRHANPTGLDLPQLERLITPIFPIQSSNSKKIRGMTIQRTQVPLTIGWAITVHKGQGSSYDAACADLNMAEENRSKGNRNHGKWASLNVQLGRVRSLNGTTPGGGLWLLNEITLDDTTYRPDPALGSEIERLERLEEATLARWEGMGVI